MNSKGFNFYYSDIKIEEFLNWNFLIILLIIPEIRWIGIEKFENTYAQRFDNIEIEEFNTWKFIVLVTEFWDRKNRKISEHLCYVERRYCSVRAKLRKFKLGDATKSDISLNLILIKCLIARYVDEVPWDF